MTDGPLIVQSDKTLLLEIDHELSSECRHAIAPFAELERAPEHIHTYRITPLGLWNARAALHDAESVVDTLLKYSRYPVPHALLVDIAETMARYGRLQLHMHPVHGLVLTANDRTVLEEILHSKKITPLVGKRIDEDTIAVHASERGNIKQALLKLGWPAEDLAGYVDATAATTANLGTSPTLYLAGQDTADKTYLEAMQEIADSERGIFYIDRLGTPKFRGSAARASGASVTLTLDASKDLAGNLTFTLDDSLYANTVVASGPAGSVTKLDATSVAAYGPLVDQFACRGSTETILGAAADNRLDDRLYSDMRLSKVVIDLLTTPNSIAATTVQLVPLDRVRVGSLPNEAPTTPFDGFVEGWELSITDSSYTCTLDLSPVI